MDVPVSFQDCDRPWTIQVEKFNNGSENTRQYCTEEQWIWAVCECPNTNSKIARRERIEEHNWACLWTDANEFEHRYSKFCCCIQEKRNGLRVSIHFIWSYVRLSKRRSHFVIPQGLDNQLRVDEYHVDQGERLQNSRGVWGRNSSCVVPFT